MSSSSAVPYGHNEINEYFNNDVGRRVSNIVVRGGVTYIGSRLLFHSLGMASGIATPLAIATTAVELAYVE